MPPSGPREVIAAVVAVAGFASWFTSGPLGNRPAPPPLIPAILVVAPDIAARPQIFIVDPGGSGRRQLTRSDGLKAYPSWSRDRRQIAFTWAAQRAPELWAMNSDGSGQHQLTLPPGSGNFVPTWAPDGSRIAFTSVRTGHPEIWVMNADGSGQRQLTHSETPGGSNAPSWSPDGTRIAFASAREGRTEVFTMAPYGSDARRLTEPLGPDFPDSNVPVWSPDGHRIAFWSGIEQQYGQVWVMNADGRNRRPLSNCPPPRNCDNPAWSPDGSQILFETNRGDRIETWVMAADGGGQRPLLPFGYGAGRLPW